MGGYEDLYKIFDKEVITLDTLRKIMNNEHVVSVTPSTASKNSNDRYDVKLDNGELYIVFVKPDIKGFFSRLDYKLHHKNN